MHLYGLKEIVERNILLLITIHGYMVSPSQMLDIVLYFVSREYVLGELFNDIYYC